MIRVNLNLNARKHIRIALCLAGFSMAGWAQAQSIEVGKAAPPSVTAQLKGTPAVVIGSVSVKPLRQAPSSSGSNGVLRPLAADPPGNTTYVVRTQDNLVGISTNDLVVMHPDTAAIVAAAGASVASAKPYPDLGLVVLHVASFDLLAPLHRAIADRFPKAKFDLPVTYFPVRPK
ncbi:MAG: hypothetical protein JO067_03075 [Cupriavidus sp.]|nr:hypothetical protein [Cupriavidus sp.]